MVISLLARPDSRFSLTRHAPAAAFVAAAGFTAEGVIALVHHTGDQHWDALSQSLNAAYAVAAVGLIIALPAVGSWLLGGQAKRAGRTGIVAAQIGYAGMAVESIVSGFHDGTTLGGLFFGGLLLTIVGLLVLGIAGLVAGAVRWAALLPFFGMLVGIAGGEHGGSIALGVVWLILGTTIPRRPYKPSPGRRRTGRRSSLAAYRQTGRPN